jgi:hypothetical protein
MYILIYVGSDSRPMRLAHDYENYIDSNETHARAARFVYRVRNLHRGQIPAELSVASYKLPDANSHDWMHVVSEAQS